jgi:hypothetical protein
MSDKWLVEYRSAIPVPIYVPPSGHYPVCDPNQARLFDTQHSAREWIKTHYGAIGGPWHEIERNQKHFEMNGQSYVRRDPSGKAGPLQNYND